MFESTYADKAFLDNINRIADCSERSAMALEAIANHLGNILGIMKMDRNMSPSPGYGFNATTDRKILPSPTPIDRVTQPVI